MGRVMVILEQWAWLTTPWRGFQSNFPRPPRQYRSPNRRSCQRLPDTQSWYGWDSRERSGRREELSAQGFKARKKRQKKCPVAGRATERERQKIVTLLGSKKATIFCHSL